jgi:fatty acid synthase subunit alpha, fungi type
MTSTRAGFVESQGCGTQLLTSARLAIEMGLPIRAVMAFTGTAADGIGRSVPRPGDGILAFATKPHQRLSTAISPRPMLTEPRQSLLAPGIPAVDIKRAPMTPRYSPETSPSNSPQPDPSHVSDEDSLNNLMHPPTAAQSAIQRALARFNLTVNEIRVLCLHATSTPVGDANELEVLNAQLLALGYESEGNVPILATCQKGLLGHGKGAAGAWAVNSALQILASGKVPGNPAIDDVDPAFEHLEMGICFPAEPVQTDGVSAISVTGFGFGQKGAQVILAHPDRFWSVAGRSISQEDYENYVTKLRRREQLGNRAFSNAVYLGDMVRIKEAGPLPKHCSPQSPES